MNGGFECNSICCYVRAILRVPPNMGSFATDKPAIECCSKSGYSTSVFIGAQYIFPKFGVSCAALKREVSTIVNNVFGTGFEPD